MLTDEEKSTAKRLGLTAEEMRIANAVRIAPETYARHKRELLAEHDAWEAKMAELDAFFGQSAQRFQSSNGADEGPALTDRP